MKDYKSISEKQKELIKLFLKSNIQIHSDGNYTKYQQLIDELASLQEEQENHSQTWMCPRCYKIHSYLKTSCDCDPNTITSTTYPQEQESDEDIVDLEDHEIHNDINEDKRDGTLIN